jgi:hypothetical protein
MKLFAKKFSSIKRCFALLWPVSTIATSAKTILLIPHQGSKSKQKSREVNTPPPPIAILLVLRKPKNQF